MCYLAEGTPFMPTTRLDRARMLQWMFFEQYRHEPNIAVARSWLMHGDPDAVDADALAQKHANGHAALAGMEGHLAEHPFFVGARYSLADIALYAYTHVAADGGFNLSTYPAILAWLARVRAQPDHIRITDRPEASA